MMGNDGNQYSQVATSEDATAAEGSGNNREALIDSNHVQTAVGTPMIEVVAPATLPEGYKFDAQVGSQLISVTVPVGGIEEGQRFTIPLVMPSTSSGTTTAGSSNEPSSFDIHAMAQPRIQVPVGSWRDHWCNFCGLGCCHAVLCNAYWCTPVLLAQVMTRMKLNYLGDEAPNPASISMTFQIIVAVFVLYIVLDPFLAFWWIPGTTLNTMRAILNYLVVLMSPIEVTDIVDDDLRVEAYEAEHGGSDIVKKPDWLVDFAGINLFFATFFLVYMVFLMYKTRRHVRNKYAIPEQYCPSGCEDLCCSVWCPCCSVSQMARHTADYDMYAASCCGETGLPPHVPSVV